MPKSRHFFPVTPMESTMNRAISLPLKGAAWLLLVLALPFANAQDMNKTAPQTFVSEASAAGVAEIEAGKMALEKSTAADVKVFAKQMIDDHGKVNAELRSLAERKKLEVEDDASLTDKAKATLLDLRDASFDPAYANNQVAAHEKAVELFTQAADNLTDPELQAFAKTHLPALKHHLEMARALAKAHPSK
ncbi:DUF4142 domain-containing protein [Pseudomonas aeruginosa]|nr:DUF4142 domain-containing protein [Pseudomonas aeruginosa]